MFCMFNKNRKYTVSIIIFFKIALMVAKCSRSKNWLNAIPGIATSQQKTIPTNLKVTKTQLNVSLKSNQKKIKFCQKAKQP